MNRRESVGCMKAPRFLLCLVLTVLFVSLPVRAGTDYYQLNFSTSNPSVATGSGWFSVDNTNHQVTGGSLTLTGSFFTQGSGTATVFSELPNWPSSYYAIDDFSIRFYETYPLGQTPGYWYAFYAYNIFGPVDTGLEQFVGSAYPTNPGVANAEYSLVYDVQPISGPLGAPEIDVSNSKHALMLMFMFCLLLRRRLRSSVLLQSETCNLLKRKLQLKANISA